MKNSISSLNSVIIEVFLFHRRKKTESFVCPIKDITINHTSVFMKAICALRRFPMSQPPPPGGSLLKCYFIPRELVSLLRYEEELKHFQEELNTATCYLKPRPCLETPAIKNICCLCAIERATPT